MRFKIIREARLLDNISRNLFGNPDIEYRDLKSNKEDDVDFVIYLGDFVPSDERSFVLDNSCNIKKDYLYCEESYKIAKWKFEIAGLEGRTIVRASGNIVSMMFIIGYVIDPIIRFKMNEKGYPVIHASGVCFNDRGYLFTGRRGSNKTMIALHLLKKGFRFLGDDHMILGNDYVYGYASPLNIKCAREHTYNLGPLAKNIGLKHKISMNLKYLLFKLTLGYAEIFEKIDIHEILPQSVVNKSKLGSIFLLLPKEEFHVEKIERDTLVDHILMNEKMEFIPFLRNLYEYAYVFPESYVADFWSTYKENLKRALPEDVSCYKVEVPKRYNREVLDGITEVILSET